LGREEGLAVGEDGDRGVAVDLVVGELEGSVFVLLVGIRRRIRQENLVLKKNALNAILIWYGNSSVSDKYSNNILD